MKQTQFIYKSMLMEKLPFAIYERRWLLSKSNRLQASTFIYYYTCLSRYIVIDCKSNSFDFVLVALY